MFVSAECVVTRPGRGMRPDHLQDSASLWSHTDTITLSQMSHCHTHHIALQDWKMVIAARKHCKNIAQFATASLLALQSCLTWLYVNPIKHYFSNPRAHQMKQNRDVAVICVAVLCVSGSEREGCAVWARCRAWVPDSAGQGWAQSGLNCL